MEEVKTAESKAIHQRTESLSRGGEGGNGLKKDGPTGNRVTDPTSDAAVERAAEHTRQGTERSGKGHSHAHSHTYMKKGKNRINESERTWIGGL